MPPEVEHAPTAAASWQQHMIDTGEGLRQPPEGQNHRARSRTPLRTAPPPAGKMVLRVSAAEADLWVKAVRMAVGDYAIFDSCHGTTNFRKSEKSGTDGSGVFYLYFWDTGDDRTGWWFGEVIGGDHVRGYAKGDRWGPPTTGWKFPWDGKEKKSVTCTLADQSGLMTTALPTGDPEPKPPPWRQCANGTTLPPPPATAPAPPPVAAPAPLPPPPPPPPGPGPHAYSLCGACLGGVGGSLYCKEKGAAGATNPCIGLRCGNHCPNPPLCQRHGMAQPKASHY